MRYVIPLVLLFCFVHASTQAQSQKNIAKANAYLKKVESLYAKGKDFKTIKFINKAYAKCPSCVEQFHLKRGENLLVNKNYAAAEASILESTKGKNSKKVRSIVWYKLAEAAFYQKAPDRALSYLNHYFDRDTVLGNIFNKASQLKKNAIFSVEAYKNPWSIDMVPLSNVINSNQSEYLAAFNTTEDKLFFTRRDGPKEVIYYANKVDGNWTEPEMLLKIGDKYRHAAYTTNDDETLIVFSMYNHPRGHGGFDLFQIYFEDGQWHGPKNLGSVVNSSAWDGQPSLSPDGKYLYFSSERRRGSGGKDLYVSVRKKGGNWSPPRNLKNINTPGHEATPFIHRDGNTLYFRSNYWPGLGDFDLFVTKRNEVGEWSEPINLGTPINTMGNDGALCVMLNGEKAILANTVNQDEKRGQGKNSNLFTFEVPEELRPNPTTYCQIQVFDKEKGTKIPATIHLVNVNTMDTLYSDNYNPKIDFIRALPLGSSYSCLIAKEGYVPAFKRFDVDGKYLPDEPFVLRVELSPIQEIKEEIEVVLENVLFALDEYEILESSYAELNALLRFLQDNPSVTIKINGHTDNTGSAEHNMELSQKRADAVRDFFISKGIQAKRLESKGYGETKPIASNETEESRKRNRRTTFVVNREK